MADQFTVTTSESWGSRLKGSFKGIIGGIVLMIVAFLMLFLNEGRAVKRHKTLVEGSGVVVSIGSDRVDPGNEGKLVHTSGLATTSEILTDPGFGIAQEAIHLERRVEMYQWREQKESRTEEKVGGGTETTTTYSYSKGWSSSLIRSSSFAHPAGHQNPESMRFQARRVSASDVHLGAFRLSAGLIARMGEWEPLQITNLALLPAELQAQAHLVQGGLYLGGDPGVPEIGDLRISFAYVPPATVSVISQQAGGSFTPYTSKVGGSLELLQHGNVPAETMFEAAKRSNKILTWILRGVGFFLMFFGLLTIFRPLSVIADVVPIIGRLVGAGTGFVAFLIAAFLSLTTISVAWVFYRPWLGISILVLAGVVGFLIVKRLRGAEPAVPPPPPPPPPVPAEGG